jgi:hypothetical protein
LFLCLFVLMKPERTALSGFAADAGLPPPQQQQQRQQQQQGGDPQLGAVYKGKVTGIMEFGCFVELTGFGHLGKKVCVASQYCLVYEAELTVVLCARGHWQLGTLTSTEQRQLARTRVGTLLSYQLLVFPAETCTQLTHMHRGTRICTKNMACCFIFVSLHPSSAGSRLRLFCMMSSCPLHEHTLTSE